MRDQGLVDIMNRFVDAVRLVYATPIRANGSITIDESLHAARNGRY